jgi:hypothetical protein
MMISSRLGILLMAAVLSEGCFNPDLSATRCSADGECPDGFTCGDDDICHRGEGTAEPDAGPDGGISKNCGDGVIQEPEQCDEGAAGNSNDGKCLRSCRWASCGDGHVRIGVEDCDPPGSSCPSTCRSCDPQGAALQFADADSGRCYRRFNEADTADVAAQVCRDRASYLAVLHTQPEWAKVEAELQNTENCQGCSLWVGLAKVGENPLSWFTGEPFSFTRFEFPEPNPDLDCTVQTRGTGSSSTTWVSRDCATAADGFVCEEDGWVILPDTHHAYRVFPYFGTWDESREGCAGLGAGRAHLATITTEAERTLLADLNYRGYRPWIGANDLDTEGQYTWITGEPAGTSFDLERWHEAPSNPKFPDDDCVVQSFRAETGFRLEEMPCDFFNVFLCEIE